MIFVTFYFQQNKLCRLCGFGVQKYGNDQTVKSQDFGENQNEDHADEKTRLLSCSSNTSISYDSNGEASS